MQNIPKTVTELYTNHSERWTQGTNARTKWRESVNPRDPNACCWCLYAAVMLVYGHRNSSPGAYDIIKRLQMVIEMKHSDDTSVVGYNDHPDRKFLDIMGLLKETSELVGFEI